MKLYSALHVQWIKLGLPTYQAPLNLYLAYIGFTYIDILHESLESVHVFRGYGSNCSTGPSHITSVYKRGFRHYIQCHCKCIVEFCCICAVFPGMLHAWCSSTFPWHEKGVLTLRVLNFWKFTSYCNLKPLWSGMGEVVPARTSPTLHPPSPPTVHQLSQPAL